MNEFDMHIKIHITESIRKKISWDCGMYGDEGADQTECRDWLINRIQDTFDSLPDPPGDHEQT